MYKIRNPSHNKRDQEQRWALPDRIFFACGACHILAFAFMARYRDPGLKAVWIRPDPGYSGNHIYVSGSDWVFDYHGYSNLHAYLSHTWKRAQRLWPGWNADLVDLPPDVLISEARSRRYDGLWLREPTQFLHDAMPRAHRYLDRFQPPPR